jgi:hypothetical protein
MITEIEGTKKRREYKKEKIIKDLRKRDRE